MPNPHVATEMCRNSGPRRPYRPPAQGTATPRICERPRHIACLIRREGGCTVHDRGRVWSAGVDAASSHFGFALAPSASRRSRRPRVGGASHLVFADAGARSSESPGRGLVGPELERDTTPDGIDVSPYHRCPCRAGPFVVGKPCPDIGVLHAGMLAADHELVRQSDAWRKCGARLDFDRA